MVFAARRAATATVRHAPRRARMMATSANMAPDGKTLERGKEKAVKAGGDTKPSPHEHAPGWQEEAASESEATIMAEKSEHSSFEDMQEKTKEHIKKVTFKPLNLLSLY